jgi:cobalt-zinc-cadmium efflux system membrane fusion protein
MKKNIILILLFGIYACGNNASKETAENSEALPSNIVTLSNEQLKSIGPVLINFEKKSIANILKVSGKIDVPPQNMVSVSMPMGGFLTATKLLPGMHINKGEIIAIMEDQQYIQLQQDYLTVQSKLQFAEHEYNRQLALNQNKASSDKVLQQANMELQTQRISLAALSEKLKLININPATLNEKNLSKTVNIYSPINGFVSSVKVNIGKYLNPSDVLFELVNPEDIHLNLNVFEKDLNKLSIGQKLFAYTNSDKQNRHPCEIILISKDVSKNGTAEVHCHFEDYDKNLLPGMYMVADISVSNHDVFVVPEEAIVSFEGKEFLFVAKAKNSFEMLEAKTGMHSDGLVEILNFGSFEGKSIVSKGAYTMLMSLKNGEEE